jgi:DNA polymerase-3 subunit beta
MKIEIQQRGLFDKLNKLKKIIPAKPSLPILNCCLIRIDNGVVKVSANNLEIGAEIDMIEANILEPSETGVAVPYKGFLDIIATLPPEEIVLDVGKTYMRICGVREDETKLNIHSSPGDFPLVGIPKGTEIGIITLKSDDLISFLNPLLSSVAVDYTKPLLTGVCITKKGGELVGISADGFRATRTIAQPIESAGEDAQSIITGNTIDYVCSEGDLKMPRNSRVVIDKNKCYFVMPGMIITGLCLEGQYPKNQIEGFFDEAKDGVTKISIAKTVLHPLLKRAIVTSGDHHLVKFGFDGENLKIISESSIGNSSSTLSPIECHGPAVDIGFNGTFVKTGIDIMEELAVTFVLRSGGEPALILPYKSDAPYRHLLMPMHLTK